MRGAVPLRRPSAPCVRAGAARPARRRCRGCPGLRDVSREHGHRPVSALPRRVLAVGRSAWGGGQGPAGACPAAGPAEQPGLSASVVGMDKHDPARAGGVVVDFTLGKIML